MASPGLADGPGRMDRFAAVAALEGVPSAADRARQSVDALLRRQVVRRRPGEVAAQVAVRDAQASVLLEDRSRGEDPDDPLLQGALRAARAVPSLAATWQRTPLQALARLHVLVAGSLLGSDLPAGAPTADLGRPRQDPQVAARLRQLASLVCAPTRAPGVVVAAVVEGEVLALRPFGSADGVVARAAARVALVATGVDTAAVCALSAGHLALGARDVAAAAEGYAGGGPAGVAAWVRHVAQACTAGAEVGLQVAASLEA